MSLLLIIESIILEVPEFAVNVTLFECNAMEIGKVSGGDASMAGHELLMGLIFGDSGRADGVAESLTCGKV